MAHKTSNCPEPVCVKDALYVLEGENGVNGQRWAYNGNAAPHGPTSDMFTGVFAHVNGAPDETVTLNDFNAVDLDFPATTDVTERGSQELYSAWIYLPKPAVLRDNNGNTGEFITAYIGGKGQVPVSYASFGSTTGSRRGLGEFATLGAGLYQIVVHISDFSVYGGFNLQWSFDGGVSFVNVPLANLYRYEPTIECRKVWCCPDGLVYETVGGPEIVIDPDTMSWCEIPCPQIAPQPVPDYEIVIVDGCDDLNQGDPANYVTITRETLFVDGVASTVYYTDYGNDAAQAEYTLVGTFIDCATGEPVEPPAVPPPCDDVEIINAYAPSGTSGVNVERWTANAVTGLPATSVPADVFTQAPDYSGMPGHANGAPDTTVIEPDFRVTDGNNAQDQFRAWTYFYTAVPVLVRDRVAWADATAHFIGECCGTVVQVNEAVYPGTDQGQQLLVSLPAGIHYIGVQVFDYSAWSGVDLEYSDDNGVTWRDLPPAQLYTQKPSLQTCPVQVCIREGLPNILTDLITGLPLGPEFTVKKPDLCTPIAVNPANPACFPKTYYRFSGVVNGVNVSYWGDNAAAHDDTSVTFPRGDFFTHVNGAPDGVGVHADWVLNDINVAADTGAANVSTDQFIAWSFIYLEEAAQLRDINGNTGERMSFWVGECCGPMRLVYESPLGDDSTWANGSRGLFGDGDPARPAYALPVGLHIIGFQVNDFSASSGVQLQKSTDGINWINFPAADAYTVKPTVEVVDGWRCEDGTYWNGDKSEQIDPTTLLSEDPRCKPCCAGGSAELPQTLSF